jgi:hypothetical protein
VWFEKLLELFPRECLWKRFAFVEGMSCSATYSQVPIVREDFSVCIQRQEGQFRRCVLMQRF